MRKRHHPLARRVLLVAFGVLALWALWAIVYETTGLPGLNYLTFGLVSLPVGAVLLFTSLIAYHRASVEGFGRADALGAAALSVVIGVLPWVMLLSFADYS
jgi:hypothetical protein